MLRLETGSDGGSEMTDGTSCTAWSLVSSRLSST